MTPGGLRRLYFATHTFLSYGLDELIPKIRLTLPLRIWWRVLFWMPNRHQDQPLGVRLRLALRELGPVWIKFGQILSTRRDLFLPHIADQLALLQDRVAPFEGKLAQQQIEKAMGGLPVEAWSGDFSVEPSVLASIAQAHATRLKENGKEVVIKVIRPGTLPIVKADMELIYRLTRWVPRLLPDGRRLRSQEVVREYKKALPDELNLLQGSANAIQLRRNFEDSPMLYVPEVYPDYCSESVMMMGRICDVPVSDVEVLKTQETNMQLLAGRGVQIFFTQMFRGSLFHAGMHSGNIFISYERPKGPRYIDIDYGTVGSLSKEDKRYLAENSIVFFDRDYRKMAELHINSGWVSPDTNVEGFEFAIRTACEPILEKPLAKISFDHVLLDLFNTARRFNMEVQPQLVLLQKTLPYVKGTGRQLYPQLDLWRTAKPFLKSWIKDQVSIPALVHVFEGKAPFWIERMPKVPELVYRSLQQSRRLQTSVDTVVRDMHVRHARQDQPRYLFGTSAVLLLSGTLFFIHRPEWGMTPGWLMAGDVMTRLINWQKTHWSVRLFMTQAYLRKVMPVA